MKSKKTYAFALQTSLIIAFVLTLFFCVYLFENNQSYWHSVLFLVLVFLVSFFIIQKRVQTFIYKRVNKIYEDLTLLESVEFNEKRVTTDMATLTREIDKYARDKKIEIESLKGREMYRKEFMGNISHELKTPLFTVQGYIETLLDGASSNKEITQKYLERASIGVERLVYIVNDLDLITRLEVGNLVLNNEEFNIIELVQSVFDLLELKAVKKKIALIFDVDYPKPVFVIADKERVQQVLVNLIVNAIKYGRENGTVEVSIEQLIKNKIIVRITDNGEGIEKINIPRLFERFYRVNKSGSRKEGGSGLGLAIVKHIIEAHDEKIYVESEFGVGSEFSFTLLKSSE